MNWKVGDVAVCIKVGGLRRQIGNAPPLRLNSEYIIQNIYKCPKCGDVCFDVGLSSPIINGEYKATMCCTEYIPCDEIHWCSDKRFAKKQTKEEQIAEAIEKEDYELANELKNQ